MIWGHSARLDCLLMKFILFCLLFIIPVTCCAQEAFPEIAIGKRKNFFKTEISGTNLNGSLANSYFPLFYRLDGSPSYHRLNPYRPNIRNILAKSPEAQKEFKLYRQHKIASHAVLGVSIGSLYAWSIAGIFDHLDPEVKTPYFSRRSAPFLLFFLTSLSVGVSLNRSGDVHLFHAVSIYNEGAGEVAYYPDKPTPQRDL